MPMVKWWKSLLKLGILCGQNPN